MPPAVRGSEPDCVLRVESLPARHLLISVSAAAAERGCWFTAARGSAPEMVFTISGDAIAGGAAALHTRTRPSLVVRPRIVYDRKLGRCIASQLF